LGLSGFRRFCKSTVDRRIAVIQNHIFQNFKRQHSDENQAEADRIVFCTVSKS